MRVRWSCCCPAWASAATSTDLAGRAARRGRLPGGRGGSARPRRVEHWLDSYTRTDTAADTLALIRHLGGPAVVVGHSFSGGSATIAAAQAPDLVSAVVEIGPFTRVPKLSLGALLSSRSVSQGHAAIPATGPTGSVSTWTRYLDHAFPAPKPDGYSELISALQANLREPGRMAATRKMGRSRPTDAEAKLGSIRCPALVVMGTLDPDWPDPRAEADAIVAAMPAGLGRAVMIDGAGHYPHTQYPGPGCGGAAAVPEGACGCLESV